MAGINVSIGVTDNATPALRKMAAAAENLERVLSSVDSRFRDAFDTSSIKAVEQALAKEVQLTREHLTTIEDLNGKINKSERKRIELEKEYSELTKVSGARLSALADINKRIAKIEADRNVQQSQMAIRQKNLKDLNVQIANAEKNRTANAEQLKGLYLRQTHLTNQIAQNQAAIDWHGRQIARQERGKATVTQMDANASQRQRDIRAEINDLLAKETKWTYGIRDVYRQAADEQAKFAAKQAESVQKALDGVAKEEAAFSNLMDTSYAKLQQEEKAKEAAANKQLAQQEALKQKAEQRLRVERAIELTEALHAREVDKVTKEYNESLALVSKLESTIDRSNKAERAQLAAVKQTCTAREKIMNLTNKLVGVRSKLTALETEGKNKTLQAANARRQERSILRQIEKHNQNIKNLAIQTLPPIKQQNTAIKQQNTAIKANTNAQKQFNDTVRKGGSAVDGLTSKIRSVVGAYLGVQTAGSLITTSDSLAANDARLQLMVKEGESVAELSDQIYAAAMRSRVGYLDMADSVAKVGIQAGNLFNNSGEMVRFMETFNKMGVISKATTQQTNAAMTQLIQALSFGQLRGDELKSILENMPMVAHALADELTRMGDTFTSTLPDALKHIAEDGKVTADEIRELGYEGAISAETVVNAMLNGSRKIDDMASNMTWTWAQVWRVFKNSALRAFTPILNGISKIIQTERFQRFATWIDHVMVRVAAACEVLWEKAGPIVAKIFDKVSEIGGFIKDNWPTIAPIILGIVAALTFLKIATLAQTAAQWAMNLAMYACPTSWIALAIMAIIILVYLVVDAINDCCNTTYSATGVIFGAVAWLVGALWNIFVALWNGIMQFVDSGVNEFIAAIEFWINAFNGGFDSFGDAVKNLISNICSWFLGLGKVVTTIIDAIFGTNWTAGLETLRSNVLTWGANRSGNAQTIERWSGARNAMLDRVNVTDWYNSGYNAGQSLENGVTRFVNSDRVRGVADSVNDPANATGDFTRALTGGFDNPAGEDYTQRIAQNTDDIARNTGATADNTSADNDEYFRYLRQMADRNSMNRNQLMNFRVDMSNVNHIRSGIDADEVMRRLARELYHEIVGKLDGAEAY